MHTITNTVLTDKRVLSRIYGWFPAEALPQQDRRLYQDAIKEYEASGQLLPSQRLQQYDLTRESLDAHATELTKDQVELLVSDAATIARRHKGCRYIETDAPIQWQENEFDHVLGTLQECATIGVESLHEPLLYGNHLDCYDLRKTKGGKPVATPFPQLNTIFGGDDETGIGGGFLRKHTYLAVGGSKSGKSTLLINFGLGAVFQGYNVLFITLEITAHEVAMRIDARILQTRLKDLFKQSDFVKKDIPQLIEEQFKGQFYIEEMLGGSGTLPAIEGVIQAQKDRGHIPDIVVVDYGDLVNVNIDEEVPKYKKIFQELFRIGQRHNVIMLSGRQVHQAAQRDMDSGRKKRYDSSDMRGGSGAIDDVSCTFTISQTIKEREMNPPRCRIFVDRSRVSDSGVEITVAYYREQFMFAELVEE